MTTTMTGMPSSTATGRVGRPPRANVFRELEPETGTSWQYELEQLKIHNRTLRGHIAEREAAQRRRRAQMQTAPS